MNTITSIDSWLQAPEPAGGRVDTVNNLAWHVEHLPLERLALTVARWTRNGRLILHRFVLPAQGGDVSMKGKAWTLHAYSFDLAPAGATPPAYPPDVAARLRQQALTPVQYDHAERWKSQGAVAAARQARSMRSSYHSKALPLLVQYAPPGFELRLDLGGRPGLYKVQHPQRPGDGVVVVTRRLKFKVLQHDLDPADEANWATCAHPVLGGLARLFRQDYAIAPDGRTIYRPGTPEDCWSFPDRNSTEAGLRYQELAPAGVRQVPGAYAWYEVAPTFTVVNFVWYSARRDVVEDIARVEQGLVRWRGRVFLLTAHGDLLPQNDNTLTGPVL